jgi:hypothetical protein
MKADSRTQKTQQLRRVRSKENFKGFLLRLLRDLCAFCVRLSDPAFQGKRMVGFEFGSSAG